MVLHAESFGHPAGETPLVLLHGFGGVAAVWGPVAALLPADLPLLAPDLPGHGRSVAEPAGGAGRIAKAVLADLEARGIDRFHLAGHSLGGAVAALIALRNPARVRSLTLLAPGGFGPEIHADALAAWRDAETGESLAAALRPMTASGFSPTEDTISELAAARARPGSADALALIYQAMFVDAGQQGVLPVAELSSLGFPVTVLWGETDGILPVQQARGLPGNVAVRLLPGMGHMLIEEAPSAVAAALQSVLGP